MIFVTGGTGFLGSYILQELVTQGKTVRALRRKRFLPTYLPPQIAEKIEWVEGDILDITGLCDQLAGCSQIIHAAALVSFLPSDKKNLFQINIEGTANLVNAAIETGVSDFLHVSSVGALGRGKELELIDEEKKWPGPSGQTAYSISKYYGEMEVWRGMGEGLQVLMVNPATLLGYGDWNESSCGLFKTSYNGFPWFTEGMNGFADVRDAAKAIVALLNSGVRNDRFIISAENREFREIFTWMANGFGKKAPSKKASPFISGFAWRMERLKSLLTGTAPLITRESAGIAMRRSMYDNQKLLTALPAFRFRSVEDSITDACRQYLKLQF